MRHLVTVPGTKQPPFRTAEFVLTGLSLSAARRIDVARVRVGAAATIADLIPVPHTCLDVHVVTGVNLVVMRSQRAWRSRTTAARYGARPWTEVGGVARIQSTPGLRSGGACCDPQYNDTRRYKPFPLALVVDVTALVAVAVVRIVGIVLQSPTDYPQDRLLHASTTVNIRGQSYRLHEKRQSGVLLDLPGSSAQKES
jgi:hypothetical protein